MGQPVSSLLNYYWRIFATGLCFSTFGVGGLVLSLTVFPLLAIIPVSKERKKDKAQIVIHHSFRLFLWMMTRVGVLAVTMKGQERLQNDECHVIVTNHPTLIDVILLISQLPNVDCIVKNALWHNPFLRGVVNGAGYINNADPQGLIDDCVNSLQAGRTLLVFPEGTRTTPRKPIKFQRGAANIALRSKINIIPVAIRCNPASLTKDQKWYQVPRYSRVNISIVVGEEIDVEEFARENRNLSLAARSLTEILQAYFQKEVIANE